MSPGGGRFYRQKSAMLTAMAGAVAGALVVFSLVGPQQEGDLDNATAAEVHPGYFWFGSGMGKVQQVQGMPTSVARDLARGEEVWHYGLSTVTFSLTNQRVVDWLSLEGNLRIGAGAPSLRGGRKPQGFTLGTHLADIRFTHGPPTSVTRYPSLGEGIAAYGITSVRFDLATNRVTGWDSAYGGSRLVVPPDPEMQDIFGFSLRSHKREIVEIHGMPNSVAVYSALREEVWDYGLMSVTFDRDSDWVVDWVVKG